MSKQLTFDDAKPPKAIHPNSTRSYKEQKVSGQTEHFWKAILRIERESGRPMTDRQVMAVLNETDVNNVRPEITRLKQAGLIEEVGKVKCEYTGKMVRQTQIKKT